MFLKLVFLKKKNVYPLWELSLILSDDIKQKQPPEVFCKRVCSSKFWQNSREQARPETCNFIKKEAPALVFSCKFCEISKNNFSAEHLQTTASGQIVSNLCCHHWLKMALRREKRNSDSHYLQEKGFHSIFLTPEK